MNEHLMRAVVLLAWYVERHGTTDPGDDVKVLEGIAAELKGLTRLARLVEFVAAKAEEAATSPFELQQRYAAFLREFPGAFGLVEPPESGK